MKFSKLTALLLCAALLVSAIAGCSKTDVPDETDTPPTDAEESIETDPSESDEPREGFDYESAYAAYAPDTVMMTVGDHEVTWDELFFYICNNIATYQSYYSTTLDLSAEISEGETFATLALSTSADDALLYTAVYYGAELLGVGLTDKDRADMEADYESAVTELGGEEELLKLLRENSYINSRELFLYLYGTEYLTDMCYTAMFGEYSENVPDEAVAELIESDGYLTAKHILRLKPSDSEDAEGKERAYNEALDILSSLKAYDGDDFDSYFDDLMSSESEDTGGLSSFPDGYLFQYGDMVSEFYEACVALEIGGLSEVVETSYGYHIIYRLPLNYELTPMVYYNQGYTATLRQISASSIFNSSLYGWAENFDPVYSDAYNSIDLASIFKEYN